MGKGIFTKIFSIFGFCAMILTGGVALADSQCDSGWYKPADSNYCQKCPPGFDSSTENATVISKCYREYSNRYGTYRQYSGTCEAGQYYSQYGQHCSECLKGYWCPGVPRVYRINPDDDLGLYKCPDAYSDSTGDEHLKKSTECYNKDFLGVKHHYNCGSGKYYDTNERRCKSCPDNYNKSDAGVATRPEDCYNSNNSYYGGNKCVAGKYKKKNQRSCTDCLDGYVCPGGNFKFSDMEDQGLYKCPHGKKPSNNKQSCVDDDGAPSGGDGGDGGNSGGTGGTGGGNSGNEGGGTGGSQGCTSKQYNHPTQGCTDCPSKYPYAETDAIHPEQCFTLIANHYKLHNLRITCEKGKYLKKMEEQCSSCLDGYKCPGITDVEPSHQENQGMEKCPTGKTSNSDHSGCIDKPGSGGGIADCNVGQYLPANKGRCEACPSEKKRCPGGKYSYPNPQAQGIIDCPINAVAKPDHSGCTFKLSRSVMKHGIKGAKTKFDEQCWIKNNLKSYAQCLFPDGLSAAPAPIMADMAEENIQSAQEPEAAI